METISVIRRTASGRVLSPTREQILRLIEEAGQGISVSQLAEMTQFHENTIRGHVTALWNDGYLLRTRSTEPDEPGRPAWLWEPTTRSMSSPYAALASVLAEQLARSSSHPETEAREAGKSWGKTLVPRQDSDLDPQELIVNIMREQGFAPEPQSQISQHPKAGLGQELGQGQGPVTEILLRQCPLIEAATQHPEIVCAVHLGMAEGAFETARMPNTEATLTPFVSPGTCSLKLAESQSAQSAQIAPTTSTTPHLS